MLREQQPINPYESPTSVKDRVSGAVRSFLVGGEETITVFVEASVWTGIRTYARDVEGDSGEVHRGTCQFEVGTGGCHEVKIEVDGAASHPVPNCAPPALPTVAKSRPVI